jgi:hypothetical protein
VHPADLLATAVAGALGALVTVIVVGASLLFVLPVALLIAGIAYAATRDDPSTEHEDRPGHRDGDGGLRA